MKILWGYCKIIGKKWEKSEKIKNTFNNILFSNIQNLIFLCHLSNNSSTNPPNLKYPDVFFQGMIFGHCIEKEAEAKKEGYIVQTPGHVSLAKEIVKEE